MTVSFPFFSLTGMEEVVVISKDCFWIKNALSFKEQSDLVEFIQKRIKGKTIRSSSMIPSPKTLPIGKNDLDPCAKLTFQDDTAVNVFIKRSAKILQKKKLHICGERDISLYKTISAAAIRYPSPDGRFPPHIDHCAGSFVYLASLGQNARFMIKSPTMKKQIVISFRSGDVLVFDPSSEAAILHAVEGIEKEASESGEKLQHAFPKLLKGHRIGFQCRVFFNFRDK